MSETSQTSGTSRLSSLLVRDGVVDVRRMERAFQRQVLFDGALDTILLEMNLLPEQRLLQYLSLATGLPPATARELDGMEPRAAVRCPRELAERYRVVPLSFDGDAMRVLARDPVDLGLLEDLASELGAPVQPFVAPEFRFELAFDRVYGRVSEDRFMRLAEASRMSMIPPVGGSPSVVVGTLAQPQAAESTRPDAIAAAAASAQTRIAAAPRAEETTPGALAAALAGVDTSPGVVVADLAGEQASAPSAEETRPGADAAAARAAAAPSAAETRPGASALAARAHGGASAAGGRDGADAQAVDGRAAADARVAVEAQEAARAAADAQAADARAAADAAAAEAQDVADAQAAADAAAAAADAAAAEAAAAADASAAAPVAANTPSGVMAAAEALEAQVTAPFDVSGAITAPTPAALARADVQPLHPTGRRTREMTPEAVRQRHIEVDQQAADAYRRHTEPSLPLAPEDTEPDGSAGDADSAPEVLTGAASEVVIEYDVPDSGALAVTAPVVARFDDGRGQSAVSGEIGSHEEASGPPVAPAPSAPTGPIAIADSGATTQSVRRMGGFDPTPLPVGEARAMLGAAEHRDEVFQILLRAIRARTTYVGLLTVQGGAAIGRVAIAGDEVEQSDIAQVLIPLDTPSAFRQAVSTASPYIGPVTTGARDIDAMIRRMGGVIPPSALLLPVVLRNRVVALVIGHRGGDMLMVAEASEILPLAATASEALGRIIMRGKAMSQGRQMPAATPTTGPDPSEERADAQVPERVDDRATVRMAAVSPDAMPTLLGQVPRPGEPRVATGSAAADVPIAPEVEALMVAVDGANDAAAAGAMEEALARPADVLPWLWRHFPGRLILDRRQIGGRHVRAAQHGHLLELAVRMGAPAAELVSEKLRDSGNDIRYYAALCASEMRLEALLPPLVERLFDPDRGTREIAIEALSSYPQPHLVSALAVARRALHGDDRTTIECAATALGELADISAIPDLLDLHASGGESAAIACRALVRLTKQDFGPSNRKWRHWWDKNRTRNRIEWLLEGLAHKETEIRRSAAEDLRKATGEYFGYHHDLPRREREQARQRWLDWWNQTGRTRFADSGSTARPH